MALNYVDWDNYTDDGGTARTLDWTSASTIDGRAIRPTAEALRQAMIERLSAISPAAPAGLLSEPLDNQVVDYPWVAAFESAVTSMMYDGGTQYGFVNHTDSAGNWDGAAVLADVAPIWTETEILADIGDPVRLSALENGVMSAEWAKQQYEILNRFRWTRYWQTFLGMLSGAGTLKLGNAGSATWAGAHADAESAYTAMAPVASSAYPTIYSRGRFVSSYTADLQTVVDRMQPPPSRWTLTANKTIDWYGTFGVPTVGGSVASFNDAGTGYNNGTFTLFSTTVFGDEFTVYSDDIFAHGLPITWCAQPTVGSPDIATGIALVGATDNNRAVIKWNVTGGFTFQ